MSIRIGARIRVDLRHLDDEWPMNAARRAGGEACDGPEGAVVVVDVGECESYAVRSTLTYIHENGQHLGSLTIEGSGGAVRRALDHWRDLEHGQGAAA